MTFCPVGLRNSTKSTHVANFLMNPRKQGNRIALASPVVEFRINVIMKQLISGLKRVN